MNTLPASCRSSARGFTLIELLVTVSMLGILLTLATPSMRNFASNQALSSVVSDLQSSANLAKTTAMTRNVQVVVAPISGDWAQGWTVFAELKSTKTGLYDAAGGDELLQTRGGIDAGLVKDTVVAPDACTAIKRIAFGPDGFLAQVGSDARNGGVQFSSSLTSRSRCVLVTQVGRIRICGSGGGVQDC